MTCEVCVAVQKLGLNHCHQHGPSAQHRAECDCKEFSGQACLWPSCSGTHQHAVSGWDELSEVKAVEVGDIITIAGVVHKKKWWQFWRGDRIEPDTRFKVTAASQSGRWETLNRV